MIHLRRTTALLLTSIALAACVNVDTTNPEPMPEPATAEEVAAMILDAMSENDMDALAAFVDPDGTVRFSPYTYVHTESNVALRGEELADLMESDEIITWGSFDGSGEPMELTFADYFDRFVYDHDYREAPEVTWNDDRISHGSMIDNISDVYPDAEIVEYHFTGFDPQYGGMDWRSLSLALENRNGEWVLVGVIHDEWTT